MSTPQFSRFKDLPLELREYIWELCLPHRVLEYEGNCRVRRRDMKWACTCDATSVANCSWPVISKVCTEARKVATRFRLAETDRLPMIVVDGWYNVYRQLRDNGDVGTSTWSLMYVDFSRTTPQLYHANLGAWEDLSEGAKQLNMLLKYAAACKSTPSLDARFIEDISAGPEGYGYWANPTAETFVPLQAAPAWIVILQHFVVHPRDDSVRSSGLFGLLGDAPIQIVDYEDEDRLHQLYNLVQKCERSVTKSEEKQLVHRIRLETAQFYCQTMFTGKLFPDGIAARVKPAAIFRLCRCKCNLSSGRKKQKQKNEEDEEDEEDDEDDSDWSDPS